MSDPLSIAASVAGLIALSSAVYATLTDFADRVDKAPKSTQAILHTVVEMRLALTSIAGLADAFQIIPGRRKAMVQLDHLVVCLTQAVITFTDLEVFLSKWPEISAMPNSARKRIRWALQDEKATKLVKKLDENRSSLILVLNILQSESDLEAHLATQTLKEQVDKMIAENREMRALINRLGDDIHTITGSVKFRDDDDSTIRFSPQAIGSGLRPAINHPHHTLTEPGTSLQSPDSEIEAQIPHRKLHDVISMASPSSRPTSPTLSVSLLPASAPRRSFELILDDSWVYARVRNNTTDLSVTSSKLQSRAWSMFSGLSLNDVSVISFIRLPLRISDIPNDTWYRRPFRTVKFAQEPPKPPDAFVIAVLGEISSGKSALVDTMCGLDYDEKQPATIEARLYTTIKVGGKEQKVELVDTAGIFSNSYDVLIENAIREAHGFIITCPADGGDLTTFQRIYNDVVLKRGHCSENNKLPLAIAVTKYDFSLDTGRLMGDSGLAAKRFATEKGCSFRLTSAKKGIDVQGPLLEVLQILLNQGNPIHVEETAQEIGPHLMGWI